MDIDDFLEVCEETMDEYRQCRGKTKLFWKEIEYWRQRFLNDKKWNEKIHTKFFEVKSFDMLEAGADEIYNLIVNENKKNG